MIKHHMNTFIPYADFSKSAACLDNKRLGKQRVECLQILKALNNPSYGWQNHPAVKMWRGHINSLVKYSYAIINEWISRGFEDTCREKIHYQLIIASISSLGQTPPWLGNESFHASHRSNLLRKDPIWYSQFGWTEPHDLPYIWPV